MSVLPSLPSSTLRPLWSSFGLCSPALDKRSFPLVTHPSLFPNSAPLHFSPFPFFVARCLSPPPQVVLTSRVHPSISLPLSRHVRPSVGLFLPVLSAAFPFQAIQQHCQKAGERGRQLKLDGVERPEKKTGERAVGPRTSGGSSMFGFAILSVRLFGCCERVRSLVRLGAIKVQV